ncbi:hypothetical protein CU048_13810 [Beijerinckiaceae bacterium]|nr:hypothetical protein CU048_13810 [Beijerinckiaceae bacterium]
MHQREKPPAVATPAALDLRVISGRTDDAENSKNDVDKQGGNDGAIAFSNSLPELAARIRAEHTAVSLALRESLGHSIAAGELLIEAKEMVPHGAWLPWLRDHCSISERTSQLYMRLARNRTEIEGPNAQPIADLTLNEAAALLVLSSDVRKLFRFAKEIESLDGEDLLKACLDADIGVIQGPGYDPFHGRSDDERREWAIFTLFAARSWRDPEGAGMHVEWILQRPFQNVDEWLGPEGDAFRKRTGMQELDDLSKSLWRGFSAEHSALSEAEIVAAISEVETAPRPQRRRRKGGAR